MAYLNISFPFKTGYKGFYFDDDVVTRNAIKSNLLHLLLTDKGERVYFPQFGANLKRYLFEPNDDITYGEIRSAINESVQEFLPNVTITGIDVVPQGRKAVDITIKYNASDGTLVLNDLIFIRYEGLISFPNI